MKCRLALPSDLPILKKLWYEAFEKHDGKESIDFYFDNFFELDNTLVLEEDGKLITSLQLNPHKLNYNNEVKQVSFIIGVATFEEYQGKGYMKVLLNYAIEYAKDTLKDDFLILQAYNWDIYRSFGFYDAYYKSKFKLHKHPSIHKHLTTYDYDSARLLDIYKAYTKDLNGYEIRDIKYYNDKKLILDSDNFKTVISDNAYLFYQVTEDSINVLECAFKTKEGLHELANHLLHTLDIDSMNVESDCYHFNKGKHLFMMVRDLNEKFKKSNNLYISEWI